MSTGYYEVLGVARDATPDEIKRAYRRLARELHPDVNPDPETQERFKEVTAAYEVLSDPQKRQTYDLGGDPFGGAGFGGAGFGFGDIMDAFFGTTSRGPRSRRRRGQDALIRLDLELAETVFGATKEIQVDTAVACQTCAGAGTAPGTNPTTCEMCKGRGEIQHVQRSFLGQVMTSRPCPKCSGFGTVIKHPCVECSGDGRVRTRRSLQVKVPGGVDTGTRIQLSGEGEVGPGAGPAGDLYVEVVELPHPVFTRRGDDLHCTVTLPMTAAALGTAVVLESFDGEQQVDIRPGTQSGQVIPLRGLGVTHLRGGGRGDVLVHVEVEVPTKLDHRQEELLHELARLRGEERPVGNFAPNQQGLFSRLRDAFNGR
ncbi:MAG: molecular chaperone DnaJ [Actinomycetia bacterium]|nr:molecular chaperone DnaJ [Actinomycetes bacterium]